VNAVCAVPVGDRQLLASAGDNGTVRFWDPVTADPSVRQRLAVGVGAPTLGVVWVEWERLLAIGMDSGLLTVVLGEPA